MKANIALASLLALVAVSVHADPRGRAVPVVSCKSAHISIRINKASCHTVGNEGGLTCQAFVAVGSATMQTELSVVMGPFPQSNIPSLMFQSKERPSNVGFFGSVRGTPNTYEGQGSVKLGAVDTAEDMICVDPQPKPGHL